MRPCGPGCSGHRRGVGCVIDRRCRPRSREGARVCWRRCRELDRHGADTRRRLLPGHRTFRLLPVNGALFSSPVIVVTLLMEVARGLAGNDFTKSLVGTIIAGSISLGVYFAIAGSVFLDLHQVPQYEFHDWQLLAVLLIAKMLTFAVSGASGLVPKSLASAPFSMVLLPAFLTPVGALQTAPVPIAVVTAFLVMDAVKHLQASRTSQATAT